MWEGMSPKFGPDLSPAPRFLFYFPYTDRLFPSYASLLLTCSSLIPSPSHSSEPPDASRGGHHSFHTQYLPRSYSTLIRHSPLRGGHHRGQDREARRDVRRYDLVQAVKSYSKRYTSLMMLRTATPMTWPLPPNVAQVRYSGTRSGTPRWRCVTPRAASRTRSCCRQARTGRSSSKCACAPYAFPRYVWG